MWNAILIADSAVGEVEALTRDVAVGVRGVVRCQPVEQRREGKEGARAGGDRDRNMTRTDRGERALNGAVRHATGGRGTYQAWTKICFALSDALVVVAARTLAASFANA